MLVISDTSPIRCLSAIGRLDLLPTLYGRVLVPPAVVAELLVPVENLPSLTLAGLPFLVVQVPTDRRRVDELRLRLDGGEAEAIVLALEVKADAILIDEHLGRAVASTLGLRPIGVLGLLVEAKLRGLVVAVSPLVEELKARIGFRIEPNLLTSVLRRVGEA